MKPTLKIAKHFSTQSTNLYYYLSRKPAKRACFNNCIRLQENRFPKKIQFSPNIQHKRHNFQIYRKLQAIKRDHKA